MAGTKEKRIRVSSFEFTASVDVDKAERLGQSVWWRYLGRPLLRRVAGPRKQRLESGAEQPELRMQSWALDSGSAKSLSSGEDNADPEAVALRERISGIYWYHAIDLGHGVVTPGLVENQGHVNDVLPADLTGKRCLDVGTFDGYWAFEMERRGASEVIALDLGSLEEMDMRPQVRQPFIDQIMRTRGTTVLGGPFALAKEILGSQVERKVCNVYELSPDKLGSFDVVHCGDMLPHIRDPQLAIENIFSVTRGYALLGSAYDPSIDESGEALMRVCPSGGAFVWWWFSRASLKLMMELSGFTSVTEVFRDRVDNRAATFQKVYLKGMAPV